MIAWTVELKSSFRAYKFSFLDSELVTIVKFTKLKLNKKSLKQEWNEVGVDIRLWKLQVITGNTNILNFACFDEGSQTNQIFFVESWIF